MNILKKLFSKPFFWMILAVGLGIFLRIEQYVYNRSLWVDEVMLAKNIINKTCIELTGPLEHHQCAPIGFLFTERLVVTWAGTSEYALRLFPLLCGIVSIVLFMLICQDMFRPAAAVAGVVLFAISSQLIYYASEVKQYGCDVFVSLCIAWLALPLLNGRWTLLRLILTAISSFFLIFFSHTAVFVLGGISVGLLASIIQERQKRSFLPWLLFCLIWGTGFVFNYYFFLSRYQTPEVVEQFWQQLNGFMPLDFYTLKGLSWFPAKASEILANPCGFSKQHIILPPLLIGVYLMWKQYKSILAMTVVTIGLLLAASAIHKFPCSQRLVLFYIPFVLLYITLGIDYLIEISWKKHKLLTILILFWIMYPSITIAIKKFPIGYEEIKPLLCQLEKKATFEDSLYINRGGQVAFEYYRDQYNLNQLKNIIQGQPLKSENDILETVLMLKAKKRKTWFLFSHINIPQRDVFLLYAEQYGKRISEIQETGAFLYCYDFSDSPEMPK